MKQTPSDRLIPILLGIIALLAVGLITLLIVNLPSSDSDTSIDQSIAIPLSGGNLTRPGDLQGTATGLQNAAPVAPTELNQLQVSR